MTAVALALGASLLWGLGDFLGGLSSRRLPVLAVLSVSMLVGFAGVAAWTAASGDSRPGLLTLAGSAGAGVAGSLGLACLYRGFSIGAMGIVAPISATGPAVPLAVDLAQGNTPSHVQIAGIAVALAGIALASREPVPGGTKVAAGVGLALLAALAFGAYFVGLDQAADDSVPWATSSARLGAAVVALLAVALTRTSLRLTRKQALAVSAIGVFDVSANVLVAFATTLGLVSVVAVLASLYPLVTVALAHAFLHERLARIQWLGAAGALAGAALIAAG